MLPNVCEIVENNTPHLCFPPPSEQPHRTTYTTPTHPHASPASFRANPTPPHNFPSITPPPPPPPPPPRTFIDEGLALADAHLLHLPRLPLLQVLPNAERHAHPRVERELGLPRHQLVGLAHHRAALRVARENPRRTRAHVLHPNPRRPRRVELEEGVRRACGRAGRKSGGGGARTNTSGSLRVSAALGESTRTAWPHAQTHTSAWQTNTLLSCLADQQPGDTDAML